MSRKTLAAFTITAIVASLIGCAKEPPKCSDNETFSLVKEIIIEKIGGGEVLTSKEIQENLKIELPRARAYDEKIKKYTCSAKLIAGESYQLPITFESQLDDKNQHIVSFDGILMGDLMQVQQAMVINIKKSRSENSAPSKSITVPAAAPDTESKSPSKIDKCVASKVDAFRKEMGSERAISQDQLNEWGGECEQS